MIVETIYMPLLDEAVDVWAPTQAERLEGGRFRLLGPRPDDEAWPFQPGDIVLVQARVFHQGAAGLAVIALASDG